MKVKLKILVSSFFFFLLFLYEFKFVIYLQLWPMRRNAETQDKKKKISWKDLDLSSAVEWTYSLKAFRH